MLRCKQELLNSPRHCPSHHCHCHYCHCRCRCSHHCHYCHCHYCQWYCHAHYGCCFRCYMGANPLSRKATRKLSCSLPHSLGNTIDLKAPPKEGAAGTVGGNPLSVSWLPSRRRISFPSVTSPQSHTAQRNSSLLCARVVHEGGARGRGGIKAMCAGWYFRVGTLVCILESKLCC